MKLHLFLPLLFVALVHGSANVASQESSAFVGSPNNSPLMETVVDEFGNVELTENTAEKACANETETAKRQEYLAKFSNSPIEVVFENNANEPVRLWWDDGKGGVLQGDIQTQITITTYVGHKFFFTPADTMERLWSTVMRPAVQHVILFDRETMASRTAESEQQRIDWMQAYHEKTGRPWRNYYPREPVQHFVYNITDKGQIFSLDNVTSFAVECPEGLTESNDEYTFVRTTYNQTELVYCIEKKPVELELKVLCTKPQVIRIFRKGHVDESLMNTFVSEFEAAHIISVGHSLGLKRSTVSEAATLTADRTSSTCWIERETSPIVDRVVRRIANAVGMDEAKLYLNRSSESLQLVYYNTGQLYKSHHDYGTDRPNNRFITFLMYLNEVAGGGNTSFPDASDECRDENSYFGLHPGRGNAMFFYNLFADGNVDPSTLHYAEPPTDGEKYMCNLWIWDPFFS